MHTLGYITQKDWNSAQILNLSKLLETEEHVPLLQDTAFLGGYPKPDPRVPAAWKQLWVALSKRSAAGNTIVCFPCQTGETDFLQKAKLENI